MLGVASTRWRANWASASARWRHRASLRTTAIVRLRTVRNQGKRTRRIREPRSMVVDPPYCLFERGSQAFAVALRDVAELVEVDALVRMGLCPPWIVGLCPYHREVVPVIAFAGEKGPSGLAGADPIEGGRPAVETVLIMQTSQGAWGVAIDRDGTVITTERPSPHGARPMAGGAVTTGVLRQKEKEYQLIDAEATWYGLRQAIVSWYEQINEKAAARRFGEPADVSANLHSGQKEMARGIP
jgi:chemotaxis signal transduction protein